MTTDRQKYFHLIDGMEDTLRAIPIAPLKEVPMLEMELKAIKKELIKMYDKREPTMAEMKLLVASELIKNVE